MKVFHPKGCHASTNAVAKTVQQTCLDTNTRTAPVSMALTACDPAEPRACTFVYKRYPPVMIRLNVNGTAHDIDAAPDTALLYVLRNDLELNGPKYGCGLGECGTCTVLI